MTEFGGTLKPSWLSLISAKRSDRAAFQELQGRVARLEDSLSRSVGTSSGWVAQAGQSSHLVDYIKLVPDPGNALSLMQGQWTSSLPGRTGPGDVPLFEDDRIKWLIQELGDISGWKVLELGPLEAGHTFQLECAGAAVIAIEANANAFIRCLIVKSYFNLRATFLLGDFAQEMGPDDHYDLIVASGVLYHMADPANLLLNMAAKTDRVMLWTHYFDPDISAWHPSLQGRMGTKWLPADPVQVDIAGTSVRAVPQIYGEALDWEGFCGGPEANSLWLLRDDLMSALRALGFGDLRVAFDVPDHPNGPSLCVLAQR